MKDTTLCPSTVKSCCQRPWRPCLKPGWPFYSCSPSMPIYSCRTSRGKKGSLQATYSPPLSRGQMRHCSPPGRPGRSMASNQA